MSVTSATEGLAALSLDDPHRSVAHYIESSCPYVLPELVGLMASYVAHSDYLQFAKSNRELLSCIDTFSEGVRAASRTLDLARCHFLDVGTLWKLIQALPHLESIELPERLKRHVLYVACNLSGEHIVRAVRLLIRVPGIDPNGTQVGRRDTPLDIISRRIETVRFRIANEPDIQYVRTQQATDKACALLVQLCEVKRILLEPRVAAPISVV